MPHPLLLSHHHGLISSLEASHTAYGPTVRLAKRWLGLQLMLGAEQVTPEAVELIVGAVFQGLQVTQPPASRISGEANFVQVLLIASQKDMIDIIMQSNIIVCIHVAWWDATFLCLLFVSLVCLSPVTICVSFCVAHLTWVTCWCHLSRLHLVVKQSLSAGRLLADSHSI